MHAQTHLITFLVIAQAGSHGGLTFVRDARSHMESLVMGTCDSLSEREREREIERERQRQRETETERERVERERESERERERERGVVRERM